VRGCKFYRGFELLLSRAVWLSLPGVGTPTLRSLLLELDHLHHPPLCEVVDEVVVGWRLLREAEEAYLGVTPLHRAYNGGSGPAMHKVSLGIKTSVPLCQIHRSRIGEQ